MKITFTHIAFIPMIILLALLIGSRINANASTAQCKEAAGEIELSGPETAAIVAIKDCTEEEYTVVGHGSAFAVGDNKHWFTAKHVIMPELAQPTQEDDGAERGSAIANKHQVEMINRTVDGSSNDSIDSTDITGDDSDIHWFLVDHKGGVHPICCDIYTFTGVDVAIIKFDNPVAGRVYSIYPDNLKINTADNQSTSTSARDAENRHAQGSFHAYGSLIPNEILVEPLVSLPQLEHLGNIHTRAVDAWAGAAPSGYSGGPILGPEDEVMGMTIAIIPELSVSELEADTPSEVREGITLSVPTKVLQLIDNALKSQNSTGVT